MPGEQPVRGERLVVVPRGVQHHLHDAFDVAVRCHKATDIHPEAARDRGPNLDGIQHVALDSLLLTTSSVRVLRTASC